MTQRINQPRCGEGPFGLLVEALRRPVFRLLGMALSGLVLLSTTAGCGPAPRHGRPYVGPLGLPGPMTSRTFDLGGGNYRLFIDTSVPARFCVLESTLDPTQTGCNERAFSPTPPPAPPAQAAPQPLTSQCRCDAVDPRWPGVFSYDCACSTTPGTQSEQVTVHVGATHCDRSCIQPAGAQCLLTYSMTLWATDACQEVGANRNNSSVCTYHRDDFCWGP